MEGWQATRLVAQPQGLAKADPRPPGWGVGLGGCRMNRHPSDNMCLRHFAHMRETRCKRFLVYKIGSCHLHSSGS